MPEPILNFVNRFGADINLDRNLVAKKGTRYYFLSREIKHVIGPNFFFAGIYLGKTKNSRFFPSFGLLRMMVDGKASRIVVDAKSEWLFVCGRDIFRRGIKKVIGSPRKDDYVLVLNRYGECLGFGRVLYDLSRSECDVAVENVLDLGDFLRREKQG